MDSYPVGSYDSLQDAPVGTDVSRVGSNPTEEASTKMMAALDRGPSERRRLPLRSSMTDCFAGSIYEAQ